MTRRTDLLRRRARLPSGVTCDVIRSDDRGVYVEWHDTGRREWIRLVEMRRMGLRLMSAAEVRREESAARDELRRLAGVLAARGEATAALRVLREAYPGAILSSAHEGVRSETSTKRSKS